MHRNGRSAERRACPIPWSTSFRRRGHSRSAQNYAHYSDSSVLFTYIHDPPSQLVAPEIKMVKHLPPAVKQLLTLRNPQPRPAPPLSRLNAVLASTFQDAKAKKAERGWLTLAVRNDAPLSRCSGVDLRCVRCTDMHAPHRECAANHRPPVSVHYSE